MSSAPFGLSAAQAGLPGQIRAEFGKDLYPLDSVLPGYARSQEQTPGFAVADFAVSDPQLRGFSLALGEILSYRLQYVPTSRLYMPAPYYRHVDAGIEDAVERELLTEPADIAFLHQSLGIERVLTGQFSSDGRYHVLRVQMVAARTGEELAAKGWRFSPHKLPDLLVVVSKWVYQTLGVELTPAELEYLENTRSIDYAAIEDFAENYFAIARLEGREKELRVSQLLEEHPDFIMFAVYAMHTRVTPRSLDEAYANLDFYREVRERFPLNAGVALESYRAMDIANLPKHEVSRRLDELGKLASANPQDPTFMIVYADALIHNGSAFKGLSVLLEAVERWPDQYRAWWSLGWALNKLAWQVRGNSVWREVPERAKREFTRLSGFAVTAIDAALERNPRQPLLWSMKINTLGSRDGYSDELMATFEEAVLRAPRNRYVYENAMNYSTARWGGNGPARKRIIDAAQTHNPGAHWVEDLRKRHVADLDNWDDRLGNSPIEIMIKEVLDHPGGKYIAVGVIVFSLFLFYVLGRRSV